MKLFVLDQPDFVGYSIFLCNFGNITKRRRGCSRQEQPKIKMQRMLEFSTVLCADWKPSIMLLQQECTVKKKRFKKIIKKIGCLTVTWLLVSGLPTLSRPTDWSYQLNILRTDVSGTDFNGLN